MTFPPTISSRFLWKTYIEWKFISVFWRKSFGFFGGFGEGHWPPLAHPWCWLLDNCLQNKKTLRCLCVCVWGGGSVSICLQLLSTSWPPPPFHTLSQCLPLFYCWFRLCFVGVLVCYRCQLTGQLMQSLRCGLTWWPMCSRKVVIYDWSIAFIALAAWFPLSQFSFFCTLAELFNFF